MTTVWTTEKVLECPVCSSVSVGQYHAPDIWRCTACDALFRNPRPTYEEIKRFYESGRNYAGWAVQRDARRSMWQRRMALVLRHKTGGSLLDIGTGDGHFLQIAAEYGFSAEGTEVSDTAVSIARQAGLSVRAGQIEEVDFSGRQFDVITLWHVLEHMHFPGRCLRKLATLLNRQGILVLAVPNEENRLFRRSLGITPSDKAWPPLGGSEEIHLVYFRPGSLRRGLRQLGFRILHTGVDDIYMDRRPIKMLKLNCQRFVNRLLGWHFSMAMYAVAELRNNENRN